MDQNNPPRPQVVTEQPVSRDDMMRDPGVRRRRGPPAHSDGKDAASAGTPTRICAPGKAVYTTPGNDRRGRRRRTEAETMSGGILKLLFFLSGLSYCF
ncbi:hypothetical protein LX36DRAFT_275413 [Colletotrichum falcatum]|nr:hypothetical protein LX36DRAFT_275413 [Colletotrichum falcatum]